MSSISKIKDISSLFDEPPLQWGLRGDPGLWDELKRKTSNLQMPQSAEKLEHILYNLFEDSTGHKPDPGKNYYVSEFDKGGMSRGMVSSDFWIEKGLPVIIKRYFDLRYPVTKMFYKKYRELTGLLNNNLL